MFECVPFFSLIEGRAGTSNIVAECEIWDLVNFREEILRDLAPLNVDNHEI